MLKKCICTFLTVIISLSVIVGCGKSDNPASVNVGSLKGPTTIGIVNLMDDATNNKTKNEYSFEIATTADELFPKLISGELDIALVPANVASVLYNKTEGKIVVLDINTLGVLYAVSGDSTVSRVKDLEGKTVYVTNKGTTPDYVTQYLLSKNGIDVNSVNIEYMSEATEVAANLKEHPENVGILPQPFVTALCAQNEDMKVLFDLTKEWDEACKDSGSRLVTGVTIANKDFVANNEGAVKLFLKDHKESASKVLSDLDNTAALVVNTGIIEKEMIAKKAIPNCNVTYIDGDELKSALSGYLSVLYEMNPESVGGKLPDEDFYY